MLEQRDEYYTTTQPRGVGCGFWFLWAVMTMLGGFVGQLVAQMGIRAFLPIDAPDLVVMLTLVPFGLVAGAIIGLAQGVLLLRYIKPVGLRDWVLASALGGVFRWALLGPILSSLVFALNTGFVQCNTLIPLMLFGALSGAAFALPQSFVLSRHLKQTTELEWWSWVLAYAAGGLFYLPFVTLSGLTTSALLAAGGVVSDEYMVRAIISMTLNWLITGLISGLPLLDRLRHVNRPTYVEF
jgi:MFS family permease